jgi:hypothetical protein
MKDKCVECPENGALLSAVAGAVFVAFSFIVLNLAGGHGVKKGAGISNLKKNMKLRMAVPFSIVMCRFQLNLEFFNIDIQWPSGLMSWLKWFDFAINLGAVLSCCRCRHRSHCDRYHCCHSHPREHSLVDACSRP